MFNRLKKILQGETRNNRILVEAMRSAGHSMPKIRKALVDLNDINLQELAYGKVATTTMYNTLKGFTQNEESMELIADNLGLHVKEIFPN